MDYLPLEFHPDARIEALEAHDWYAERSNSAAEVFQDELQDARRAIQDAPDCWASFLFGTRQYVMKRFPFVVVYRVATDRIEIITVAHGAGNQATEKHGWPINRQCVALSCGIHAANAFLLRSRRAVVV